LAVEGAEADGFADRIVGEAVGAFDASSVIWGIEAATKVRCLHRGAELLAEATPATARKLSQISDHIAQSFRALLTSSAPWTTIAFMSVFRKKAENAELAAVAPKCLAQERR